MRLPIVLVIAITCALAWAAPASAGTVCNVGGVATFLAADVAGGCPGGANAPTEVNALTVSVNSGGDIVFTDPSNPVLDGDGPGGCSASGNVGTCPGALSYQFDLGGSNDTATVGAVANGGNVSTGGDGNDHLIGGPLGDLLDGGSGADQIEGGDGNDTISGGDGNDTLSGGDGADQIHGDDGADVLNGDAGTDTLTGGAGADVENGGDDNDSLDGGGQPGCIDSAGNDTLNGGDGDDALCGGAGPSAGSDSDTLNGGNGEDIAFYVRSAAVSVSLDEAANDGEPGESDNVRSDVEDITGGSGADTLIGNDGRNVLDGGAGPDSLLGLGGNDVLTDSGGDNAADRLDGGAGDDLLAGGRGPDTYIGGDGEDAITDYASRAFGVTVTLDGVADDGAPGEGDNAGTDVEDVTGTSAADTLVGNASDNELTGGAGDDTISGGAGNDGLSGGAGADTIDGGAGRDDLEGGSGADSLNTRDGLTDYANCGGGSDRVQGEARDDITGNCEDVKLSPPTAVTLGAVQVTRAGFVVVTVTCPVVERTCSGAIIVKTIKRIAGRVIKLGQVNYRLRQGQGGALKARIGAPGRKSLKRARRVKVRAVVTNLNGDTGQVTTATKLATVITRGL